MSRAWRKVKTDWESWQARDLSGEDIVRLILDGTGVKARLDGRVLSIPLLVVLGVRRDGQKVLLAVKNMGGETEAAWRHVLEDLLGRGLKAPELLIVDGGKGLEAALASLWSDIPVQRCTVHKERNLLAHAPKALHDEVKADYTDMMYAENAEQVRKKRKAFLAKWRLRCRGVADSLEEAGERLFTFLRYPPQQFPPTIGHDQQKNTLRQDDCDHRPESRIFRILRALGVHYHRWNFAKFPAGLRHIRYFPLAYRQAVDSTERKHRRYRPSKSQRTQNSHGLPTCQRRIRHVGGKNK